MTTKDTLALALEALEKCVEVMNKAADRTTKDALVANALYAQAELTDEAINAIKQADPAIKESLTAQWQPIESAPKDGTLYLAREGADMWVENEPEGHLAGVWSWSESRGQWRGHAHADERFAAHWIPLPAAPEAP
jgi:hypothetical protein